MKKFIYFLILPLIIAGIYSCTDSLGIDRYDKTLIQKDTTTKLPPQSPKFAADSVNYYFEEYYKLVTFYDSVQISPWQPAIFTIKAMIDTTNADFDLLWLDLNLKNSLPDRLFLGQRRTERIVSFHMIVDSVKVPRQLFQETPLITLYGNKQSGKYSDIRVKRFGFGDTLSFSELKSRMQVSFRRNIKSIYNHPVEFIESIVTANFPAKDSIQTYRLEGTVSIYSK